MLKYIYLSLLSTAAVGFLIRKELIHWKELYGAYEIFDNTKSLVEALATVIVFIFDLLKDTAKYLLIALALSLVSMPLYVWALARPCRWKAYTLLLIGLVANWCGMFPPEPIAERLANDKYSLVQGALIMIGLVYMATAVIQLTIAESAWRYFKDDIQERWAQAPKEEFNLTPERFERLVNEHLASFNWTFKSFWNNLTHKERQEFLSICAMIAVKFQDKAASDEELKQIAEKLSEIWNSTYHENILSDPSFKEFLWEHPRW